MASVDWLGILIGGAITFVVSLAFYVPAARSLKRETASLQRHTTMILRGLEEAGLVECRRNAEGEIEGIVIKGRAALGGSGSLSIGKDEDTPADQE